jgi:hypothetical protein
MGWRNTFILGSSLLMEAMWTYAVVAFFVAAITDGGEPSFPGVCAVVLISYAISRFLQGSELSLGFIRAWGTLLSFLVFYVIVRADFFDSWEVWNFDWSNDLFIHTEDAMRAHVAAVFGVPLLCMFWVRGLLRGQQRTEFDEVVASFGIGVLIIAFIEIFEGSVPDMPGLVGQLAIPYVAFGLISIALAHSARADTDRSRPYGRMALISAAVCVAALAFVAAAAALFDFATGLEAAQDGSNAFLDAGRAIGNLLLWPLLQVLDGLFSAIIWVRDLVFGEPPPPEPPQQEMAESDDCIQMLLDQGVGLVEAQERCNPASSNGLPEWIQVILRLLIMIPIVGAIVLAVALVFTRFRRRAEPGELKESAYQQGRLASDLSDLWQGLLSRLRPNIRIGRDHLDPVRKLYFEVLDDAERRGLARRPAQTPDELAPALDETFHAKAPGQITRAFDDVRYGAHAASEAEARRLREDWETARDHFT